MAVEQVGARQTDTAKLPTKDAKWQVTVPSHGGQQQRRFQLNWADLQHEGDSKPSATGASSTAFFCLNPWILTTHDLRRIE